MSKKSARSSPESAPSGANAPSAEASSQIWLAGLGAFAKAQQQGGKVFEALVQEGLQLQRKTQAAAQAQLTEASHKLGTMTGDLGARAGQQWDRLEGIFEQRVARALQRLNVATQDELQALLERVLALENVSAQAASPARRRPARSAKAAPAARQRKTQD